MSYTEVRCSERGCKNAATWSRQAWLSHSPDQPVCDDHVKFYRAQGLTCNRIDHTKVPASAFVGFQCPACGHDMGKPINSLPAGNIYRCEQCKMNWFNDLATGEVNMWNG
jgi:predicted RNA-binding Zn-ribbon protein involved in translation (DUF1610 family)